MPEQAAYLGQSFAELGMPWSRMPHANARQGLSIRSSVPSPPEEDPRQRQQQRNAAKRWAHRRRLATQIFTLAVLIVTIGLYIWPSEPAAWMYGPCKSARPPKPIWPAAGLGPSDHHHGQQRTLDQIYRALWPARWGGVNRP